MVEKGLFGCSTAHAVNLVFLVLAHYLDFWMPLCTDIIITGYSLQQHFKMMWLPSTWAAVRCVAMLFGMVMLVDRGSSFSCSCRPRYPLHRWLLGIGFVLIAIAYISTSMAKLKSLETLLFTNMGVLHGIGSGFIQAVSFRLLSDYFPRSHKWQASAFALLQLAQPVALVTARPLFHDFITTFKVKEALQAFSGCQLVLGGACALAVQPLGQRPLCRPLNNSSESDDDDSSFEQEEVEDIEAELDEMEGLEEDEHDCMSNCFDACLAHLPVMNLRSFESFLWLMGQLLFSLSWSSLMYNGGIGSVLRTSFGTKMASSPEQYLMMFGVTLVGVTAILGPLGRWITKIHLPLPLTTLGVVAFGITCIVWNSLSHHITSMMQLDTIIIMTAVCGQLAYLFCNSCAADLSSSESALPMLIGNGLAQNLGVILSPLTILSEKHYFVLLGGCALCHTLFLAILLTIKCVRWKLYRSEYDDI